MVSDDVQLPSTESCTGVRDGRIGGISVSVLTAVPVFVHSVLHQESPKLRKQSIRLVGHHITDVRTASNNIPRTQPHGRPSHYESLSDVLNANGRLHNSLTIPRTIPT